MLTSRSNLERRFQCVNQVAVCPHYLRFTAHLSISQRKIGSGSGGRRRRRRRRRGSRGRSISMNWISRKIHLYNVTMGLYMLDWWSATSSVSFLIALPAPSVYFALRIAAERVDILILVLLWFIFYNGSRSASEFYNSYLKPKLLVDGKFVV
uniref:Uncharacterized protein n=1 Tax=Ananas comosus var. bracteatus TaxID=296719 RepID=A0A6V7NQN3_ANACO|nr:unnamed protein product [Ananas comosus var. bracteatus]